MVCVNCLMPQRPTGNMKMLIFAHVSHPSSSRLCSVLDGFCEVKEVTGSTLHLHVMGTGSRAFLRADYSDVEFYAGTLRQLLHVAIKGHLSHEQCLGRHGIEKR